MSTLIHLLCSGWQTACKTALPKSGVTLQSFNHQMTGEPRAVTCLGCKKTAEFKASMDQIEASLGGGRRA